MTTSPSRLLTPNQVRQINDALLAAGDDTTARIVPVVAASSGRYERSEDLLGLWASALGLTLVWWLVATHRVEPGEAGSQAAIASGLLLILAVVATGFILGGLLAGHIGSLRRMFIPARQLKAAVRERAGQVLRDCVLRCDEPSGPLVVIYISLYERDVEVVAQDPIDAQLSPETVEAVRQVVLDGLIRRRPCEAICQAIDMIRDLAAAVCPLTEYRPKLDSPRLRLME